MSDRNQSLSHQNYSPQTPDVFLTSDEIDLRELVKALWDGKLIIITLALLSSICSGIYAFKQPNIYQASSSFVINNRFYSNHGPDFIPQFFSSNELKESILSNGKVSSSALEGVRISYNNKSRVVSVTKSGTDPQNVFDSVSVVMSNINNVLKSYELEKINVIIEALEERAKPFSPSVKAQERLDELFAQHLFKKAMLESPDSRVVQVIKEPLKAVTPIKPDRGRIVVLGALLGSLFGAALVLGRFILTFFRR